MKEVLSPFSGEITHIMDKFSFLLPKHPYECEFKPEIDCKAQTEPALTKSSLIMDSGGNIQPKFFFPVKEK